MERNDTVNGNRRRARFLLLAPLVALPFLFFLFWKMGVGRAPAGISRSQAPEGLSSELPDMVRSREEGLDKLDYYERAERDSQRLQELIRNDPYHLLPEDSSGLYQEDDFMKSEAAWDAFMPAKKDPGELISEEIFAKLADLNKELKDPQGEEGETLENTQPFQDRDYQAVTTVPGDMLDPENDNPDMVSQGLGEEGEISELNSMLDKIIEIQNPTGGTYQTASSDGSADSTVPVTARKEALAITSMARRGLKVDSFSRAVRFYSLEPPIKETLGGRVIQAVVHGKQELTNGSTLKMHLLEDVSIAGREVSKGHLVFARVSFSSQRMEARVSNIRVGPDLLSVDMQVHDLDGMRGINIPGNLLQQGMDESTGRTLQGIGLSSLDTSWETKAASVGIQAAKSMIGKKLKAGKVILPTGYRLLLFDKKQNGQ